MELTVTRAPGARSFLSDSLSSSSPPSLSAPHLSSPPPSLLPLFLFPEAVWATGRSLISL